MLFSGPRCSGLCTLCGTHAVITDGIANSNQHLIRRMDVAAVAVEGAPGVVLVGVVLATDSVTNPLDGMATFGRTSIGIGRATLGNAMVSSSIIAAAKGAFTLRSR